MSLQGSHVAPSYVVEWGNGCNITIRINRAPRATPRDALADGRRAIMGASSEPWELAEWDAVETAARIRRGDVTAREVVEAALARADDAAALNALVTRTSERAREGAATAARGVFHGVPSAVKDLAQVAGVRTAWGSAASGEFVSARSDAVVDVLARMGLVSVGKSATPEFGLTATTEPLAFGPCRNPWSPAHSPGGSSGGAGALVAAGVVPIAHASDGGGSIRIPASCCGLVGLKASRGRFDMEASGALPVNIGVHGALTRTVRDMVAFWQAVEAQRPAPSMAAIGEVAPAPRRRLRLGVFVDAPTGAPVHPEVRGAVERAAALCEELGHEVRPLACPFAAREVDDFVWLWSFLAWVQARGGRVLVHGGFDASKVEPFTAGFASRFSSAKRAAVAAMWRLRGFASRYADIVAPYDALVGPTLAQPPPPIGHLATDAPFETALERLLAFTPFTALLNAAGAPALSLPLGRSASGLPLGVQFAAAHGAERTLLELAGELETARPWPRLAPRAWAAM